MVYNALVKSIVLLLLLWWLVNFDLILHEEVKLFRAQNDTIIIILFIVACILFFQQTYEA